MFDVMKITRISNLIILGQFVLLLIGLGFLGYALVNDYCLKSEAKRYATTAGLEQAIRNFSRGDYYLYETKFFKFSDEGPVPTDGDIEPTGKTDGQFRIYYFLVGQEGWEKGHQEIQQAYIDGYNQRMHLFFEHPEWFDKNGFRISVLKSQANTNSPISTK
jgi:hypothetical protein